MPLESGIDKTSTPDDLNPLWPLSNDLKSEGDDHIRNTKQVLQTMYQAFDFDKLPIGAIPAVFNGAFDDSKMMLRGGGLNVDVPVNFETVVVNDPENIFSAPVPYAPVGMDALCKYYKTEALSTTVGQTVDAETSSGPIAVSVPVTTDMLTTLVTLRGAALVTNVRLTIRKIDANGPIIIQTASDQELKTGGFTLAATGDTTIPLFHYWVSIVGADVHISLERYDSLTDTIIATGIPLKGVTILGNFVPYFNRTGFIYTLVELQDKLAATVTEALYSLNATPTSISGAGTSLINEPVFGVVSGGVYRWKIYTLVEHDGGGGDAWSDVIFNVDGVPVDHYATNTLGEVYIDDAGRTVPFTFEGRFTAGATEDISLEVIMDLQSQAMIAHRTSLTVERVG